MLRKNKKINKNKANNKINNKTDKKAPLIKRIEDFFYSDTPAATATKFLLMFAAIGGIAVGGAIVPGILKAIKEFEIPAAKTKRYGKKQINNALINLKRQKLIDIVKEKNGKIQVKLTNKGKKRLLEFSLDTVRIKKPKKWDGKWRIVMFDIPNELNAARESLRRKIKELNFYQFQKSAWIFPYECEDEILFIAETFNVQQYVEIITADKFLHEEIVKKKFKLI
ncbi:MAG: repressor in ring oxydation complex/phenylacetic acid degradation pathway related protein (PaaX) [uncultured bacterium]|nr:MAG: repressor in ring oxydation complex/phenylacetic acid degradation pathway related protein (PaaX) [uncultured bacterium]HBR71629.1 hypothetical protein [Candidatus Moranbacteria bacterium]